MPGGHTLWPPGVLSQGADRDATARGQTYNGGKRHMGSISKVASAKEDHDAKITDIVVNGQKKDVAGKEIGYRDVVAIAFENPWGNPNIIYTVTYTRGQDDKPQGTLVDGQSVKVKKGMVFNVTRTDKS